jgi:hypothetical protein
MIKLHHIYINSFFNQTPDYPVSYRIAHVCAKTYVGLVYNVW